MEGHYMAKVPSMQEWDEIKSVFLNKPLELWRTFLLTHVCQLGYVLNSSNSNLVYLFNIKTKKQYKFALLVNSLDPWYTTWECTSSISGKTYHVKHFWHKQSQTDMLPRVNCDVSVKMLNF